jgi:hypothetical protein
MVDVLSPLRLESLCVNHKRGYLYGFGESYELRSTASTTIGCGMTSSTSSCALSLPSSATAAPPPLSLHPCQKESLSDLQGTPENRIATWEMQQSGSFGFLINQCATKLIEHYLVVKWLYLVTDFGSVRPSLATRLPGG